ncbi:hypothetical protein RIF29_33434 [Crotalaria pallida]|uniref:Uncharacterized protein n=1 Tax=Crotalaria pallida TaxID=3830 RepID=A0AAN9E846_CROPI
MHTVLLVQNRDTMSGGALDLNAYSEDANLTVYISNHLNAYSWHAVMKLPESATPKYGTLVSAECVGGKTNKDAQGNLPMIEKNDAANVEVQGMLPMEKNNNADNVEPSPLHQL